MRFDAAALLAELDPLAYPERMRMLALRARALAGTRDLGTLLDDLYCGDQFQRGIAVFMAAAGGHRHTIAAALEDPAWDVRRPAVSAWLRSGAPSAGQVAAFVAEGSWHDRRHVYRLLRRLRAAAVADELIEVVWDRFGDDEAAGVLSACSAPVVARLLPELGYAAGDWSLLGRLHPEVVLTVAGAELAELPLPERARWWARSGPGVLTAGPVFPLRTLDLLERYAPSGHLPGPLRYYSALAAADSARLIRLMAAPGRSGWLATAKLPGTLLRRLARLDVAELAPVARRLRRREGSLVTLLDALPPARRPALYAAAYADVERGQATPSDKMLDVLPRAVRWAEARRVLRLGPVRADEARTLHYTAFLPWAEAQAPLTAATRRAQAEERAAGYEMLAACAGRTGQAEILTEVIAYFRRLRNEQDPVRARALTALAQAPPSLLRAEAAEALAQITADALAARDTSSESLRALTTLALAVLRQHSGTPPLVNWSLRTLQGIFGDQVPMLGRIDTVLRRGQEREFLDAVRDWLEAGIRRGSYQPLFAVTRALGRRAWQLPELQDMLRRSIDPGNVSGVVRNGITLWLDGPANRSERVGHVLEVDSSAVALPDVWALLCRRRTDLLDRFLTGAPPPGKFLAAGVRWVPLRSPGTGRWLPRQQTGYAMLLAQVAADAGAKMYERTAAITAAASLGEAGWDVAQRHLGGANTRLAEAALAALAMTGRPRDALPILLSHAGDDQARVAVYAAGRVARFIPPRELAPTLTAESVADGKVTTRKEALRLAATVSVPDAGAILLRAWHQPGQHRDVRAAIASAARQRPHDPASWTVLGEAAAGGPEEAQAVVPSVGPLDTAPRHRHRYGQLVTEVCRNPDQSTASKAWHALQQWAVWAPHTAAFITARLTDLDDRILWPLAVPPLFALLDAGRSGAMLGDVTGRLANLDHDMADADEPGRDRPARQRLRYVIEQITTWVRRPDLDPEMDRAPLADAGRHLAMRTDFTREAATLLIAATRLGPGHGQQLSGELSEICDLLEGRPATADRVAQVVASHVANDGRADPETLYTAVVALGGDSRLCAGLFAAALARQGAGLGWPAPWRARVRGLRGHPLPDVRAAALEIIMAPE